MVPPRGGIPLDRESLEVVFQNCSDGVLIVDRRRRIMHLNPAAEAITGWRLRDLDLMNCGVLGCKSPSGAALCAERCMSVVVMESGLPQDPVEAMINTADGGKTAVEISIMPVRSGDGRVTAAAMLLRDLSQVARFESVIRSLNDEIVEKNLVLRGISQGLATGWKLPLVTIQSATNTLQGYFAPYLGESGLRHVKRVAQAVQELESLFARLQAQVRSSASSPNSTSSRILGRDDQDRGR